MANVTEALLHGYINSTHTTNLTAYYPPNNFPTPYPLVLISVLISVLIISYSCVLVIISVDQFEESIRRMRDLPKSPRTRKNDEEAITETELEDLLKQESSDPAPPHKPVDEPIPEIMTSATVVEEGAVEEDTQTQDEDERPEHEQIWARSRTQQAIMVVLTTYSSFRAVVAFMVNVSSLFDKQTSASAPSNLLLILISMQMMIAICSLPRFMRSILTLDMILAITAFGISLYGPLANRENYPAYGRVTHTGGNCPVFARDCNFQTTSWSTVGCGNYTFSHSYLGKYFTPYATGGDPNDESNPLFIAEKPSFLLGILWLLYCSFQILGAIFLIRDRKRKDVEWEMGIRVDLANIVSITGPIFACLAVLICIIGHMSAALGSHYVVYMDSLGPPLLVNGAFNHIQEQFGINMSTYNTVAHYWGNATTWTDCFNLKMPTSSSGLWNEWVEINKGAIYRIAAGV